VKIKLSKPAHSLQLANNQVISLPCQIPLKADPAKRGFDWVNQVYKVKSCISNATFMFTLQVKKCKILLYMPP